MEPEPDDSVGILFVGSIPCVLCWEGVTNDDIKAGTVVLQIGRKVVPAHLAHFYSDVQAGTEAEDYDQQMMRFSLAIGIAEKLGMPHLPKRQRKTYWQMVSKMGPWNYHATVMNEAPK